MPLSMFLNLSKRKSSWTLENFVVRGLNSRQRLTFQELGQK